MQRQFESLTRRRWDLLVIGGGIHGLFAALDAAQRGLSVALVEAEDFGGGLSLNHQRTLHGGLRALQRGNVPRVRRQIEERRTWARMAPHLVRPLPFLVATYRGVKRSRLLLRAGLRVYDSIGRRRNAGVSIELHIPKTRLESAAATKKLFPGVPARGLTGGAIWYDYQTRHPDRLTWLVAAAARDAGATIVNYACAEEALRPGGGRITGARLRDVLTGTTADVDASITLLAAGAALGSLQSRFGAGDGPPLMSAMSVLLDRPARDIALAAPGRSGRMLTAVPWSGAVLVGTALSDTAVTIDRTHPLMSDVEAFVAELNRAFPSLQVEKSHIRLIHYGLVPAVVRNGRADLLAEHEVIRHAGRGVRGLVSLVGVKYTTARWAAAQAVDAVCAELGGRHPRSRTADATLPHAAIADTEGRLTETERALGLTLDRDVFQHLASWYGTEAPAAIEHAARRGLLDRLDPEAPVLAGEIAYAVATSAAQRLADVVLRRTALGGARRPARSALERAAAIMADRLDWTPTRVVEEIAAVEKRYEVPRQRLEG
jgi:glycerol-3-phosphate dehydrogenase